MGNKKVKTLEKNINNYKKNSDFNRSGNLDPDVETGSGRNFTGSGSEPLSKDNVQKALLPLGKQRKLFSIKLRFRFSLIKENEVGIPVSD